MITQFQLASLEGSARYDMETAAQWTGRECEYADARAGFRQMEALVFQEVIEAPRERREMLLQQARSQIGDQPLQNDERLQLLGREPQPGKLVGAAVGSWNVAVAAELGAVLDGRAKMILERTDQPVDRGFRTLELGHELFERDGRAPTREEAMEMIDPVEFVHAGWRRCSRFRSPYGTNPRSPKLRGERLISQAGRRFIFGCAVGSERGTGMRRRG